MLRSKREEQVWIPNFPLKSAEAKVNHLQPGAPGYVKNILNAFVILVK
jgi:hypothetical protein